MTPPIIERHMDEIDAAKAASAWIDKLIRPLPRTPHFQVVRYQFARPGGGCPPGGLSVYWYDQKLLAQITIFRDDANFSIVTMIDLRPTNTAAEAPTPRLGDLDNLQNGNDDMIGDADDFISF